MKKIIVLVLSICLLCSFIYVVNATDDIRLIINGREVKWEEPTSPYIDGDEIMIPLKKVANEFGIYYEEYGDNGEKNVAVAINYKVLYGFVGYKEYAVVNVTKLNNEYKYGEPVYYTFNNLVEEKNGDIFFPLSKFSEVLELEYKQSGNTFDFVVGTYKEDSDSFYDIMLELYNNQVYASCIEHSKRILVTDPTFMSAYYYLGGSYYNLKEYDNAYKTLIKQLSFNPNNEIALYNAACIASLNGLEEESIDFIERILSLNISKKSNIKEDIEFNNIRNNKEYKNLMGISVVIGGELVKFDVAPIVIDGRTLLPMRAVFECFGAQVNYDNETKTAIAKKGDLTIEIPIGSKIVKINGQEKELDVPAMSLNGRTLIPIRFIGETLNGKVDWDGVNEVINISFPAPTGNADYNSSKKLLDNKTAVSVIDGMSAEPYSLNASEGVVLIIIKEKQGLDTFNNLSLENKSKYINDTVYKNFGLVLGCNPVYSKVVYEGKVYYEGIFDYDKKDDVMVLTYHEKGKPINVIKQYKNFNNYKDFYLLPKDEQTTSEYGD